MSDFFLGIVYSPVVSRFALQTFIVLRYSQLSFTFKYKQNHKPNVPPLYSFSRL